MAKPTPTQMRTMKRYRELKLDQHNAFELNDRLKVRELQPEIDKLSKEISGSAPIVGQSGRTQ